METMTSELDANQTDTRTVDPSSNWENDEVIDDDFFFTPQLILSHLACLTSTFDPPRPHAATLQPPHAKHHRDVNPIQIQAPAAGSLGATQMPKRGKTISNCLSLLGKADNSQGTALLQSSQFNKGSAFPSEERTTFKLRGLLPPNIQTLDEQVQRAYQQYSSRENDLAKNTFMASMKAQNEVLYYKVCHGLMILILSGTNRRVAATNALEGDVQRDLHAD